MSIRNLLTSGLPANESLDIVCDTLTANTISGSVNVAPDETYTDQNISVITVPGGINIDPNTSGSLYMERYGTRVHGWLQINQPLIGEPDNILQEIQIDTNIPASMRPASGGVRRLTMCMLQDTVASGDDKDTRIGSVRMQGGADIFIDWEYNNWLPTNGTTAISLEFAIPAFSYLTIDDSFP